RQIVFLDLIHTLSPFCHDPRLSILKPVIGKRGSRFQISSCLILSVKFIDILDELPVEQVKRDSLRTYPAALAAVRTSSCHMESADDVEHLLLEGVHIGLLGTVELVAVKYAFSAAACRTYISAGIAADTFAQLFLEECELLFRAHSLDLLHFGEAVRIFCLF